MDLQPILEAQPLPETGSDWGDFHVAGAWHLTSPNFHFGGYSSLLILPGGRFFAPSDGGRMMFFSPPDAVQRPPRFGYFNTLRKRGWASPDIEAITRDPASGRSWIAFERSNAVMRNDAGLLPEAWGHPPAMRDWPRNTGPEAMVRLADGRFIILSEGSPRWFADRYPALLFPGDPISGAVPLEFTFKPPAGFRPVDAAQLPDGRMLILLRKTRWSLPPTFTSKLMVADPATIRSGEPWQAATVLDISPPRPSDNYEGMAIEPGPGGAVAVWLISDDNRSMFQRTLLLKLIWRPNEKARGTGRALS